MLNKINKYNRQGKWNNIYEIHSYESYQFDRHNIWPLQKFLLTNQRIKFVNGIPYCIHDAIHFGLPTLKTLKSYDIDISSP